MATVETTSSDSSGCLFGVFIIICVICIWLVHWAYIQEKFDCDRRGGVVVWLPGTNFECVKEAPGWDQVFGEHWE